MGDPSAKPLLATGVLRKSIAEGAAPCEHRGGSMTSLVALFSAPVGNLWLKLLANLGIDAVWSEGPSWRSAGASVSRAS